MSEQADDPTTAIKRSGSQKGRTFDATLAELAFDGAKSNTCGGSSNQP